MDQSPSSTRITVSRDHPKDVRRRPVHVDLDGRRIGTLQYGEHLTIEVPSGEHELRADNTLFKKKMRFSAAEGEQARFVVTNRAGLFSAFLLMVLGTGPLYISINRVA